MPIVKITQKGWETYNGYLEGTEFVNGTSIESMSIMSAERLGCAMSIVDAETNKPVSGTQRVLDHQDKDVSPSRWTTPVSKSEETAQKSEEPKQEEPKQEEPLPYTREDLETIADKGGITALREFAKEYKVNGTSIVGIIDALMDKKG